MPIGSTIWVSGSGEPSPMESSAPSSSETKNPRYLKTPSRVRSKTIATVSARFRAAGDGLLAITWPATVLTTLDAIRSSTQRQSTQP